MPQTESEHNQCFHIWREAFQVDDAWCRTFEERAGWDLVRCAERNGDITATTVVHDFGQYFGGTRLPCAGVALVACGGEHRGRGIVRSLLADSLREQHERGIPLSALYPSTRTLYRRLGYESAGGVWRYTVPLLRIDVRDHDADIRRIDVDSTADMAILKDLYLDHARTQAGLLDRNDFLWHRVVHMRDGTPRKAYIISVDGKPRGYFVTHRTEGDGKRRQIEAWDVVALDDAAGRAFLHFMAHQRSIIDDLVFWGGTNHPLLMLLGEQRFELKLHEYWMLRVLNVAQALRERGYPQGLDTELHLEVHGDDVIESNNDRFVVRVKDGRAEVGQGGRGDVRITIRGLAPLFSGHLAPIDLVREGAIQCGCSKSMDAAMMMFCGPQPYLADGF